MTMTRRHMDRNIVPFRSAVERFWGDWPWAAVDGSVTELAPPIDVSETGDAYQVEIDLPGVDPKNLEILIEGRTLTIRGQMNEEKEETRGTYLVKERRQGQFMRAVALPGMVDVDQVQSRFENGQLTLTLPKAAQNRARRIELSGATNSSTGQPSSNTEQSSSKTEQSSSRKDGKS
jgi:HSP20 family protein